METVEKLRAELEEYRRVMDDPEADVQVRIDAAHAYGFRMGIADMANSVTGLTQAADTLSAQCHDLLVLREAQKREIKDLRRRLGLPVEADPYPRAA